MLHGLSGGGADLQEFRVQGAGFRVLVNLVRCRVKGTKSCIVYQVEVSPVFTVSEYVVMLHRLSSIKCERLHRLSLK